MEELQNKVKKEGRLKEAAIRQAASLSREVKERGTEIAPLREAISKLKKVEVSKYKLNIPKKHQMVQTDVVEIQVLSIKMQVCIYTNVASQAEKVGEEGKANDKMDIDTLALSKQFKKSSGVTLTPKPMHAINANGLLVRAFVMHMVGCHALWQQKIQEVERAFGRKGGGVISVR